MKKAGVRPLSVLLPGPSPQHESCKPSIALGAKPMACSGAFGVAPSAVPVEAIVGPLGRQRTGQRERLTRLAVAPHQLHRATEAEQRVVVGRRLFGERPEL